MIQTLKATLRRSPLYASYTRQRDARELQEWKSVERAEPLPHHLKQRIIGDFARRFSTRVFVETGTFRGDMVQAMRDEFSRIFTIELDPTLAARAAARFAGCGHVEVLHGDSGQLLPEILRKVDEPCLFWLDGHYSGGVTAHGALETPIEHELTHILQHPVRDHVLLIDDARLFVGKNDYPTTAHVRAMLERARPDWATDVEYDMIRAYPRA